MQETGPTGEREERVLVVPRETLFGGGEAPRGFVWGGSERWLSSIREAAHFVPRGPAEEDPLLQQLIPYGVVVRGEEVFLLRRRRAGSEQRLHDRLSLGVGGHVNPPDATDPERPGERSTLERAMERELHEELRLEEPVERRLVGVVKDDASAVGAVHFGLVFRLAAGRGSVEVRERDRLEGAFVPRRDLPRYRRRLESWSAFLLDWLTGGVPAGPGSGEG